MRYEAAFPIPNSPEFDCGHYGMTLRDYFAAAALTGLLANSYNDGENRPLSTATALEMSEMSYRQADAMLKARTEPQSQPVKGA